MTHRRNKTSAARWRVLHEGTIPWASVIFSESLYDGGPVGKQCDVIEISEATNFSNTSSQ